MNPKKFHLVYKEGFPRNGMALLDSVLRFIAGKWFTAFLGIGLIIALLTTTWPNFLVIYEAGKMGQYWYLIAVFIVNVVSIIMCIYRFMNMLHKPKPVVQEEW